MLDIARQVFCRIVRPPPFNQRLSYDLCPQRGAREGKPMTETMKEKCAAALNELIAMCMDGGMSTFEIADVLEAEIPKLRQPYQNPEDNG